MKARWKALLARFDALSQRERALVAAAIIGGILLGGNSLFIDLPLARGKILSKQLLTEGGELLALQTQLSTLQRELHDPDEDNRVRLVAMRKQLQDMRTILAQHEKQLVAPQDIPRLLEQMLARHSALRLISLQTLPTVPGDAPETKADEPGKMDGKSAAEAPRRAGLEVWRHGVEIRLQGSYADLSAYVLELESLPQRLVWGEVRLKADYPKSELHLKIYTYSLDQAWLRL
ncbi:MAG: hypothetical protein WAV95_12740 [Azonexus sp.]